MAIAMGLRAMARTREAMDSDLPVMQKVVIDHSGTVTSTTIDRFPDECPFCHGREKQAPQNRTLLAVTNARGEYELFLAMRCLLESCGRTYFGVYRKAGSTSAADYTLAEFMPPTPLRIRREKAVENISRDFYEIYDQASVADEYGLSLIAGAGYRKAIEYLVKDYVVSDRRKQFDEL